MSQDFSKAKIYKITNDYNNDVYVGSTCDSLTKRFSGHKLCLNSNKNNNRPIYKLMNEIGFERFRIELIEDYPCQDKYQLRQREGYFIREIGTLNKKIEGRTMQEYYIDNKNKIQESRKEYYEDNKDKIFEYNKEYYEDNKNKILEYNKEYNKSNKDKILEYQKEYYEDNKNKILEYGKEYYEDNKNKILEYKKEKITCDCGCIIRKGDISSHKKTNKHINLMKTIQTGAVH